MRKFQGLSFLLIITLTWMELAWVADLGMSDCYEPCNYGYHGDLYEQRLWYEDIYNFLYCDCSCPGYPYYYDISGQPYNYSVPAQPGNYDVLASYQTTNNNDTANYWLNEADKLYLIGSYEDAAASYAKAVKLNPSLSMGWLNMGNALYFLNRYQESLDAYNATLKLEPQNSNALHGKAQTLLALNRTQEANVAQTAIT
ncbi:MAG: tetratricopeptide repeat protein [Methanotrichaceae archaeon]|nr:tetratricopeptide repeat protein [Methanotrichaceae archaeon]